MPELPDFNVPGFGKPLSQIRQDTWDKLQDPKYQKQLVLVTVSIGNRPPFYIRIYIYHHVYFIIYFKFLSLAFGQYVIHGNCAYYS